MEWKFYKELSSTCWMNLSATQTPTKKSGTEKRSTFAGNREAVWVFM